MTTKKLCKRLSKTLKQKGKEYGNAVEKTASILKILYPSGIDVEQFDEAQYIIRILDKIGRIVHGARNENNWGDAAGYCIRAWESEERKSIHKKTKSTSSKNKRSGK